MDINYFELVWPDWNSLQTLINYEANIDNTVTLMLTMNYITAIFWGFLLSGWTGTVISDCGAIINKCLHVGSKAYFCEFFLKECLNFSKPVNCSCCLFNECLNMGIIGYTFMNFKIFKNTTVLHDRSDS